VACKATQAHLLAIETKMAFTIARLLLGVGQGHGHGSGGAELTQDGLQRGLVVISVCLLLLLPVTALTPVVELFLAIMSGYMS
jgi:hypothetical protein